MAGVISTPTRRRGVVERNVGCHGLCNSLVVVQDAALERALEPWRENHDRISAMVDCMFRRLDGVGHAHLRGLHHHRYSAIDVGQTQFDDAAFLIVAQVGVLAGAGQYEQSMHASVEKPVEMFEESWLVDPFAGVGHRHGDGDDHTMEILRRTVIICGQGARVHRKECHAKFASMSTSVILGW